MVVPEVVSVTRTYDGKGSPGVDDRVFDGQVRDVVVVGGGVAGLTAAVTLARARRSVVVIDAGSPRNAPADGVHGFLSRDGIRPAELLELGREELYRYGGQLVQGEATAARRADGAVEVDLDGGHLVRARRLLVATGLVDELPDVVGVRERWGRDVLHCPYCHGWEIRDRALGVLGTGPFAVHQALLFRQWTPDVVLFTHTAPPLTEAEAEQLAARGIRVVDGTVDSLEVVDDRITGVRLVDGSTVARQALAVMPRFAARSKVLAGLGLQDTDHPLGVGTRIVADPYGLTQVPGVWVAGNVTEPMIGVVASAAAGMTAATVINADLVTADTAAAVADYRSSSASLLAPASAS